MKIEGQHRSLSLAERHLSELQRNYPDRQVEIVARRNSKGQYSSHGHYFTFEVKEEEIQVWIITFRYP
jgi:hypothetical protein